MDKVGIGTVKIIVTPEELTEDDWNHLQKVIAYIKNENGETKIEDVSIDKENKSFSFLYKTEIESYHTVNVECFFDDGTSITSYEGYTFLVQRG
jgi:hypothetical protein